MFSNVSEVDMTIFHLSKKGYGTIEEIEGFDTPRFLDLVEFESIINDIDQHHIGKAK